MSTSTASSPSEKFFTWQQPPLSKRNMPKTTMKFHHAQTQCRIGTCKASQKRHVRNPGKSPIVSKWQSQPQNFSNPLRYAYAWHGQKFATLAPRSFCHAILRSDKCGIEKPGQEKIFHIPISGIQYIYHPITHSNNTCKQSQNESRKALTQLTSFVKHRG